MGVLFTCRHHDCIFSYGQARQEKPSDNKLFWNGNALVFNKSYDYFISRSAGLLTYPFLFFNLEGCFNVTSSFVLHLESSGALFWDSCCCWHCSVSCLPYLALLINMLVVYMKPNIQHNWNVTLCRYVLSFALGAGPVPALLLPEIFASRIRAKAVALSLGMHWVSHNCSNMHK